MPRDIDGALMEACNLLLDDIQRPTSAADDANVDQLGWRLHLLAQLNTWISEATAAIETQLTEAMPDETYAIVGLGQLVRDTKRSEAWRDEEAAGRFRDDFATAVVKRVALDVATGELDPVKRNVAVATLDEALDAIGSISRIKVAAQRRLGVDMHEYRTTSHTPIVKLMTITEEDQ